MRSCSSSSHARVGGKAAVDRDRHAGDEAGGVIIQEKQHRARELLALAEAAHGRGGEDLARAGGRRAVLVPEERGVLRRGEEARRDRVHADALTREMHREPLGEVRDGGLRAGVGRDLGQRREGVHGADVQDQRRQ